MGKEDEKVGTESEGGTQEGTTVEPVEPKGGKREFKPITISSQEEFDDLLQDRLRRHERSLRKSLADEVRAEVEEEIRKETSRKDDEEKGNYQKLYEAELEKNKEAEAKALKAEVHALKIKLVTEAGYSAGVASRISGETEDAILADIEEYKRDAPPAAKTAPTEPGTTSPGGKKNKPVKSADGRDLKDPETWGLPKLSS